MTVFSIFLEIGAEFDFLRHTIVKMKGEGSLGCWTIGLSRKRIKRNQGRNKANKKAAHKEMSDTETSHPQLCYMYGHISCVCLYGYKYSVWVCCVWMGMVGRVSGFDFFIFSLSSIQIEENEISQVSSQLIQFVHSTHPIC